MAPFNDRVKLLWEFDTLSAKRTALHIAEKLISEDLDFETRWVPTLAMNKQTTRPASLDGCPRFAPAYMGRRRRAQPLPTLLLHLQRLLVPVRAVVLRMNRR
jgi:hypothetical protein